MARKATDGAQDIGVQAYVYLYPLVMMEITRRQLTSARSDAGPGFAPMGTLSHARAFPPPEFRAVVRPNFDTLYSAAWLDVTSEPTVISVPDTGSRYYLLPLLDMWTDVFAAPGSRTTGTAEAHFALVPPRWRGTLPEGVQRIESPTPYVWLIGRTQTNGAADYEAVHRVQDALALTRLSDWGREPAPRDEEFSQPPGGAPLDVVNDMSTTDFFRLGTQLLNQHGPHLTDWSMLALLRTIGISVGPTFNPEALSAALGNAYEGIPTTAQALMQDSSARIGTHVNGWIMHSNVGVYGNAYLARALIAMGGLGANPPEDAVYPLAVTDADGAPIVGEHAYQLHFGPADIPPVEAFWSLTMYDAEGFPVPNPLDRYALGDRDPLVYNADGSLDLYLQHDDPGAGRTANWLPAPRGPLGITMRLYAPAAEVLNGRWQPPPLLRVT